MPFAGVTKNLLPIFALEKLGLVVKVVDDRCTIHDLSSSDTIVALGTLFCGLLHKLNACKKSVASLACTILDSNIVSNAKFWHAQFGHLNFASLLHLQK